MFQTIIKKTIQDFSMLSNIPLSYNINTILNGQETINNTARCLHQTQGPVGFDGDITTESTICVNRIKSPDGTDSRVT